jgi:RNA polymerase sigma-70 factor (ECF subfamily)
LPDNYRVILSLHLLEGYDHEEIAQILEISYNLSRTRYSRAKKKLLEYIGAGENGVSKSKQN